ncbi:MAG TPA: GNAT family N-acetyltransferase [Candidatus Eisenbacteria bacterium]|nr:GNAT family N-acetyltransferase [Candidatus Eisenbacteria bacterium]
MPASATPRLALAADAAEIARVHVASWRTTYPGLLPARYLDAMDVRDYEESWARTIQDPYRRSAVLVVEEEGRVVGFASCGRERDGEQGYEGELYAIYLVQEAQGRGHGRALVQAAAAALAIRGLTSMIVWVLRDNARARGFYERLGARYVRGRPLDLGLGFSVPEVAYLWADTGPLRRGAPA